MLSPIVRRHHEAVTFFLTFDCNHRCSYCINLHDVGSRKRLPRGGRLSVKEWIEASNRFSLPDSLPIILQGGEPTLYPGFYRILQEANEGVRFDLLTNLSFDVEEFIREAPIERFRRKGDYAAIRASYHPGQADPHEMIRKVLRLSEAGFRVALYAVNHPDPATRRHLQEVRGKCEQLGVDFRLKELVGFWQGKLYGTLKYPGAVSNRLKSCLCRTIEVLVGPGGDVYRCYADMYSGRAPIGHILNADFSDREIEPFRTCSLYGDCNPCNIKVKTDQPQSIAGYTSVEIWENQAGELSSLQRSH